MRPSPVTLIRTVNRIKGRPNIQSADQVVWSTAKKPGTDWADTIKGFHHRSPGQFSTLFAPTYTFPVPHWAAQTQLLFLWPFSVHQLQLFAPLKKSCHALSIRSRPNELKD